MHYNMIYEYNLKLNTAIENKTEDHFYNQAPIYLLQLNIISLIQIETIS